MVRVGKMLVNRDGVTMAMPLAYRLVELLAEAGPSASKEGGGR